MPIHRFPGRRFLVVMTAAVIAGCSSPALISGFRPVYPQLPGMLAWGTFPVVNSLQPTLRWQPFPGEHSQSLDAQQSKPFVAADATSVQDVQYDLKIWTVRGRAPGDLVREADGLSRPEYRVEPALQPDTEYYWTVRARYRLDGQPRTSEWSMNLVPCPPPFPECFQVDGARRIAQKNGQIPPQNYYRFKTPPG